MGPEVCSGKASPFLLAVLIDNVYNSISGLLYCNGLSALDKKELLKGIWEVT